VSSQSLAEHAVGAHHPDFDQTGDDEVARVMQTAHAA
jgi:predicted phosphoribosyltransferase